MCVRQCIRCPVFPALGKALVSTLAQAAIRNTTGREGSTTDTFLTVPEDKSTVSVPAWPVLLRVLFQAIVVRQTEEALTSLLV